MSSLASPPRPVAAHAIYALLNPIPFGCFVAALVFDIVYLRSGVMQWAKGAAWLLAIGLVFAVVPRLLNLARVWFTARHLATRTDRFDFWLNLFAIVAAILNSFVHSRDAYAIVPAGLWLSVLTVILLCIGAVVVAVQGIRQGNTGHE
ncbi:hypothetical protein DT603_15605 [Pseudoxanthomonas gei]|uniref:DUF2231 domain-containing protein n=1 Tax=Pseudoxanthomonas gei TaxID=1383030 RepID=A0ABX0AH84_9GAMM|nr:DUF2231 domain-containing protein [Pseudoxanthomonas gei]NDK40263.1 hypothetical protein [Pseudoxanthomonas gei]